MGATIVGRAFPFGIVEVPTIANLPFTAERVKVVMRNSEFVRVFVRSRAFGIECFIPENIGGQWWLWDGFRQGINRRRVSSIRHLVKS